MEEAIRRATGLHVRHNDDGTSSGQHDAVMTYPDKRVAALEMASLADPAAFEVRSLPAFFDLEETRSVWMLTYQGYELRRKEVERFVPGFGPVSGVGRDQRQPGVPSPSR